MLWSSILDFVWETQCKATVYLTVVFLFHRHIYMLVYNFCLHYELNVLKNLLIFIFINYLPPIMGYESIEYRRGVTHGRQQPKLPNSAFLSRNLTKCTVNCAISPRNVSNHYIISNHEWIYIIAPLRVFVEIPQGKTVDIFFHTFKDEQKQTSITNIIDQT